MDVLKKVTGMTLKREINSLPAFWASPKAIKNEQGGGKG